MNTNDDEYWNEKSFEGFSFEDEVKESNLIRKTLPKCEDLQIGLTKTNLENVESLDSLLSKDILDKIFRKPANKTKLTQKKQNVSSTIENIVMSNTYSLEPYRTLEEKTKLLKEALETEDGNTILTVVIFLTSTLKKSIFQRILRDNPVAASHYVQYLYSKQYIDELIDTLEMLGRTKDAMMMLFKFGCRNPQNCLQRFNVCVNLADDQYDKQMIIQLINLVGKYEVKCAPSSSVVALISGKCKELQNIISCRTLANEFNLSAKQLEATLLITFCQLQNWVHIDDMFVNKNWLGKDKVALSLPIGETVKLLYHNGAPSSSLTRYIKMIKDSDERLELAKKFNCHHITIDDLASKKDRRGLLVYKTTLQKQTESYYYADTILKSPSIKWKN